MTQEKNHLTPLTFQIFSYECTQIIYMVLATISNVQIFGFVLLIIILRKLSYLSERMDFFVLNHKLALFLSGVWLISERKYSEIE